MGIFASYIQNKNLKLNVASFSAFICHKIGNEHHYCCFLIPCMKAFWQAVLIYHSHLLLQLLFPESDRLKLMHLFPYGDFGWQAFHT